MRKLTLALAAGTLTLAGLAYAQPFEGGPAGMQRGPATKTEAVERANQMFERLDANDDGVLNQDDRSARVQARFDKLDTDGNGVLSVEEFSAQRGRDGRGNFDKGKMGKNGDRAMHRGPAGLDKDGEVTKAEFAAKASARFDMVDANGDGTITQDERKAHRDTMKQARADRRAAQN